MILVTQQDETVRREARQYLEDRTVGTTEGVFWIMQCISTRTIIVPNIDDTIHLGMLKPLMDWVMTSLKQRSRIDKFNQFWAMMLAYFGFMWFHMPYSQLKHSSCQEIEELGCLTIPAFVVILLFPSAIKRNPFTEAMLWIENLEYFNHVAQYYHHTEATIEEMENYQGEVHRQNDIFCRFRDYTSTKMVLEAVKTQCTLEKPEEREIDLAWNNLSAATKCHCIDEVEMQTESDIP